MTTDDDDIGDDATRPVLNEHIYCALPFRCMCALARQENDPPRHAAHIIIIIMLQMFISHFSGEYVLLLLSSDRKSVNLRQHDSRK